jgi:ankyrin repeat protein
MITLARKKVLRRALGLRSSSDHRPLDAALVAGNHAVVKVLLERAGNLCFQDTKPGHNCALHYAVIGNDVACVRTLLKFLKKYSSSIVGWDSPFEAMLEWRDLYDSSPLALLCDAHTTDNGSAATNSSNGPSTASTDTSSLLTPSPPSQSISQLAELKEQQENQLQILQLLIQSGADVGVTNRNSQSTPLMGACTSGSVDLVKALLAVKKPTWEGPQVPTIAHPSFPVNDSMGGTSAASAGAPQTQTQSQRSAFSSMRIAISSRRNPFMFDILPPRQNPLSLLCCKPCDRVS